MANFHSLIGGLIPGYEKLFHRVHDAEAKQKQRTQERDHDATIRACQHRAERANAERVAFEAERDSELYMKAAGSAASEAKALIGGDCELERTLVERAGLRRLRESISVADLSQNGLSQALTQTLMRPTSQLPQATSPQFTLSAGVPGESGSGAAPPLAAAISAEDIDKLAIRFVTRISTAGDDQERDLLFSEWRDELYRQLPKWQANEVEQRARELLHVIA